MSNRGAYGFRLICPEAGEPLRDLIDCTKSAPLVTLSWRRASTWRNHEYVSDTFTRFGVRGASSLEITRDPPTIMFDLAYEPVVDALVHPLGTIPLAILARWRGDITLHGGCFATSEGAWGVVGRREAGKSTTLATIAERGFPLLGDDLITVLDGTVSAGPACVDLRPDVAPRFPGARDLGIISGRQRFRLSTRPGARAPLRGLFQLAWVEDANEVAIEPLTVEERLRLLYELEYVMVVGPPDPKNLLELVDVPAWRVSRPRAWGRADAAIDAMLEIAGTVPQEGQARASQAL